MKGWFRRHGLIAAAILLVSGGMAGTPASNAAGNLLPTSSGGNPRQQAPQTGKNDLTISVAVDFVTLDVSVDGKPQRDLQAEDFIVYDNDVAQQLTHFSRDLLPLSVALVVDLSGSIQPYIGELKSKARSALGTLRPEDRVVLFGFNTFAARFTDLTRDSSRVADLLGRLRFGGSTNICDGVFIAARYLRETAPGLRKAVILLSDNCHNVEWGQTWESTRRELLETGVTLWGIQIRGSGPCSLPDRDQARQIAEDTGGGILDMGAGLVNFFTGRTLTRLLNQAITNLRTQYTLGFVPSDSGRNGSFHRLRIALREGAPCPKCRLTARTGYYAGTPPSAPPGTPNRRIATSRVEYMDADVYNRITIAAADMSERNEIPFDCRYAVEQDLQRQMQMRIDLKVDVSGLEFRPNGDRHAATLCVGVFSGWPNGSYSRAYWRTVDLQLREDTYLKMMTGGVPVSFLVPAAASGAVFKVVICDARSKKVGSRRSVIR